MSSIWITKRRGKRGMRYLIRWIDPCTGKNPAKTFRRMEDAREFQAKLQQDFRNNEYHIPVKISYDEWVIKHLEDLTNSPDIDLAPKTIAGHKEALMALGKACNPKNIIDITPKTIRYFRQIQLKKGLTPRTVNKHISAIRSALSYAVRAEIIPANKLLGPHRLFLHDERKIPQILTVDEVKAILIAAGDLRHKAAISLAYYHGLRRGEIAYLKWMDVDFEQGKLCVVNREDARTKTRKSRSVSLRHETAEILAELCVQRTNEYIFEKPKTFYYSVDKWFENLIKKAGIKDCTLHDLRKTCNTLMKDAGVAPEVAMQVLGHSTYIVNERYYTGMLTEQQKAAVNSVPSIG
ncbi:MAG: tyrosine-type recombinase/integrase [Planctomycetota bacterium]